MSRAGRGRSVTLEELHGPFVLFGSLTSVERPEVSAPAGLGVFLSRVQSICAGL